MRDLNLVYQVGSSPGEPSAWLTEPSYALFNGYRLPPEDVVAISQTGRGHRIGDQHHLFPPNQLVDVAYQRGSDMDTISDDLYNDASTRSVRQDLRNRAGITV